MLKVRFQLDRYACLTVPAQVLAPQSVNSRQVTAPYSHAASTRRVRLSLYATLLSRSSLRRRYLTLSRKYRSSSSLRHSAALCSPTPLHVTLTHPTPPRPTSPHVTPHATSCLTPHNTSDIADERVRHAVVDVPTHDFEATVACPLMVTLRVRRAWQCGPRSRSRVPPYVRRGSRRGLSPRSPRQVTRPITKCSDAWRRRAFSPPRCGLHDTRSATTRDRFQTLSADVLIN